jgi:hypothetical protein
VSRVPKPPSERRRRNREPLHTAVARTVPSSAPAEVPRAPALLTTDKLQRAYRRLWRSCAVANVWRAEDAHAVARLVLLRDRIAREGDDAKPALYSAVLALEQTLLPSPRARRASGVTVDHEHTPATLHVLPGGELEQVRAALAEHGAAPR